MAHVARKLGMGHITVRRVLLQEGVQLRRQGVHNFNYGGEKILTKSGYLMVYCPPEFSGMRGKKTHRVFEHRLVMAQYLGRELEKYETVHHINSDRSDNRVSNLQLRIGKHGNGSAYECLNCGSFNIAPVALKSDIDGQDVT